jgi:hypothetical protein
MNEKPKSIRVIIKYPANLVTKVPLSPSAKEITKKKNSGMKKTIKSNP